MFPLSDHAEVALRGATILLACAWVFTLALRWRPLALIPLVGLGLFGVQQFSQGSRELEFVADVLVVGAVTILVGAAFAWVHAIKRLPLWARVGPQLPARRLGQAVAFAALAAAPAALWAVFVVQRQYLPAAPCATAITVEMGNSLYRVPIGFGAYLDHGSIGPEPGRRTIEPYSLRTQDKEVVNGICRETMGGSRPLPVFGLRLYAAKIEEDLDRLCQETAPDRRLCQAREEINFGNFQYIRLTSLPDNDDILASLRWNFDGTPVGKALVGGDLRDGFVCWVSDPPQSTTRCYVMLPVNSTTTAIVETQNLSDRTPEQIQSETERTLDVFINALLR